MNLFTTYTPEETKFLLSLENIKFSREKHPLFVEIDIHKLKKFYKKRVEKKEIIKEFDFVLVEKGKIGVVKNSKVVRVLEKGDCFISKVFLDEDVLLLGMQDSEVVFFSVGEDKEIYENILKCIAGKMKNKILL